ILEQARRLAAQLGDSSPNHYDVLGVARDADDKAIRAAFRQKARDYHGDRFARFKLSPEDAAVVQKVFIAVNRAHETLTDPAQRKEHDVKLEMEARGQKVDPSGDPRAHIEQALKAEKLVRNGVNLLRAGKAQAALERFDEALMITPDDLIATSGRAYAEVLVARQSGPAVQLLGRAREKLEGIVGELSGRESEFGQPEPFLYLGLIYVLGEQWDKADHVLKQAIAVQAHCDEAVSTLRHVQRKAAEPQKGLKGLFGRRKK
ncbi:MAG: J domain-containing protein, partial [Myxococcales bacterium]|nr:J domain-containing protein [Myxococcales bacterium]